MTEKSVLAASRMKVTDEELIKAIWILQVKKSARGCIHNYIGDRKGVASESHLKYSQDIHIMSRHQLGVDLSNGHLRKRLVTLIESGAVQWSTNQCSFWINNEKAKEVFDYACDWWSNQGVPSGYDQERKAMRCEKIEEFDDLATQLEEDLVLMFGEYCA
ncbi:MAG: hypothetical protein ACXV8O_01545 [Methylobacter sp.]